VAGSDLETTCLPCFGYHPAMSASRSIARLEADLVALRAAAERAGTALACLFSTADEFEAAVVRVRREQGAYGRRRRTRSLFMAGVFTGLLTLAFLVI
jgi:hypothetical protein